MAAAIAASAASASPTPNIAIARRPSVPTNSPTTTNPVHILASTPTSPSAPVHPPPPVPIPIPRPAFAAAIGSSPTPPPAVAGPQATLAQDPTSALDLLQPTKALLDQTWATAVAALQRESDARKELAALTQVQEATRKEAKSDEEARRIDEDKQRVKDGQAKLEEEKAKLFGEKMRLEELRAMVRAEGTKLAEERRALHGEIVKFGEEKKSLEQEKVKTEEMKSQAEEGMRKLEREERAWVEKRDNQLKLKVEEERTRIDDEKARTLQTARLESVAKKLNEERARMDEVRKQLEEKEQKVNKAKADLEQEQTKLKEDKSALEAQRIQSEEIRREDEHAKQRFETERQTLEAENQELEEKLGTIQGKLLKALKEIKDLEFDATSSAAAMDDRLKVECQETLKAKAQAKTAEEAKKMVMEHCQRLRTRLEKSEAEKTSLSKELEKHRSNAGTGTPTVAKQNTGTRPKSLPLLSLLKSQSPATPTRPTATKSCSRPAGDVQSQEVQNANLSNVSTPNRKRTNIGEATSKAISLVDSDDELPRKRVKRSYSRRQLIENEE